MEIISLGSLICSQLPARLRGGGAARSHAVSSRPWQNPKSGRSDKGGPTLGACEYEWQSALAFTFRLLYTKLLHLLLTNLDRVRQAELLGSNLYRRRKRCTRAASCDHSHHQILFNFTALCSYGLTDRAGPEAPWVRMSTVQDLFTLTTPFSFPTAV